MPPRAKKTDLAPRRPRKKYPKKVVRPQIPCKHCGQIFDFPADFCECCRTHSHVAFMDSTSNRHWCLSCEGGRTPASQKWMRENRCWTGPKCVQAAYDNPEFYDMTQEINNMTIMPVWITHELGNAH